MNPLLSIVTITRDDLSGVLATVESTRELRQSGWVEQIIIDSSSPPMKADELPSCKGLRIVYQPPRGVSAAFNEGLNQSQGDWIWFLNGEDTFHEGAKASFLLNYLKSTLADATVFEMESSLGVSQRPAFFSLWPPVFNWIPHPATLMRRELLVQLGGFREDFKAAMDVELWLRLLSSDARLDLMSIPLARFAPAGLSSNTGLVATEIRRAIYIHRRRLRTCFQEGGHKIWRAWRHFGRLSRN